MLQSIHDKRMQFEDTTKSTEILNTVSSCPGEDTQHSKEEEREGRSGTERKGRFTVMDSHHQAIQEEEKWFSTKLGLEMGPLFVWLQGGKVVFYKAWFGDGPTVCVATVD